MSKYYYEHNGELQEIELKKHKVDAFKASNPHLEVKSIHQVAKAERDTIANKRAVEAVQKKRAAEYPSIGDQLDAIMKWAFSETEIGLPEELKSLAGKCMSVKAKHPLPK